MNDNNNSSSSSGKYMVGVILAGLAGYTAGVLTAPKSGSETRQDIKRTANKVVADLQDKFENLREDIDDLIIIATDKSYELKGKAKTQLNDAVEKAKDAKDKASTVAKAVKNGEADEPELNRAIKQLNDAKKNLVKYLKS